MKKELEKLNFEITINAPVEKVWETMLEDKSYRVWAKAFSTDGLETWYEKDSEGEFKTGEKVRFVGKDENGKLGGMLSEVAEIRKYDFISFRHLGYMFAGEESFFSIEKNGWTETFENYTFKKIDENKTEIKVYMDSDPEYTSMFIDLWPKGLLKLKEMCE